MSVKLVLCLRKLNLERLTVRLELTVLYFPIFRQARPECLSASVKLGVESNQAITLALVILLLEIA